MLTEWLAVVLTLKKTPGQKTRRVLQGGTEIRFLKNLIMNIIIITVSVCDIDHTIACKLNALILASIVRFSIFVWVGHITPWKYTVYPLHTLFLSLGWEDPTQKGGIRYFFMD